MPKSASYSEFWANPYYNGTTFLKEPEVTCNNCPESDECPGFDACVFLAANCKHKQKEVGKSNGA